MPMWVDSNRITSTHVLIIAFGFPFSSISWGHSCPYNGDDANDGDDDLA